MSKDGSESSKMAIHPVMTIRVLIDLSQDWDQSCRKFLDRYPFSSAKAISKHFRISPSTVKQILRRELGLKKFSRRSVPHLLSHYQKKSWVDARWKLLSLLGIYAAPNFKGIATGDESWFKCSSYSD
jgi:hypothetical protein